MRTIRRASRKTERTLRPRIACIAVVYNGDTPYDALDFRIRNAMDASTVTRLPDGRYRATSPAVAPFSVEGETRRAALAELWEECRWLLADPVRISFVAEGREWTAEVLAERRGGYSVKVPELPGCFTEGRTMSDVRKNVVEAAEAWLECQKVSV